MAFISDKCSFQELTDESNPPTPSPFYPLKLQQICSDCHIIACESKKSAKKFGSIAEKPYLCIAFEEARAFSSAGLEHLPYKQRVGGSNPSTPTQRQSCCLSASGFFAFKPSLRKKLSTLTIIICTFAPKKRKQEPHTEIIQDKITH